VMKGLLIINRAAIPFSNTYWDPQWDPMLGSCFDEAASDTTAGLTALSAGVRLSACSGRTARTARFFTSNYIKRF